MKFFLAFMLLACMTVLSLSNPTENVENNKSLKPVDKELQYLINRAQYLFNKILAITGKHTKEIVELLGEIDEYVAKVLKYLLHAVLGHKNEAETQLKNKNPNPKDDGLQYLLERGYYLFKEILKIPQKTENEIEELLTELDEYRKKVCKYLFGDLIGDKIILKHKSLKQVYKELQHLIKEETQ